MRGFRSTSLHVLRQTVAKRDDDPTRPMSRGAGPLLPGNGRPHDPQTNPFLHVHEAPA